MFGKVENIDPWIQEWVSNPNKYVGILSDWLNISSERSRHATRNLYV
jgi:hypothetical protein